MRYAMRSGGNGGVERLAHLFGEGIEVAFDEDVLQSVVKRVARRAGQIRPTHHQIPLPRFVPPHRHAALPGITAQGENQPGANSSTGW